MAFWRTFLFECHSEKGPTFVAEAGLAVFRDGGLFFRVDAGRELERVLRWTENDRGGVRTEVERDAAFCVVFF